MAHDYDSLYRDTPDALGPPTAEIVAFFDRFDGRRARVLDIGCGQGRDALFIARRGHAVTGIDISPHGIRDLKAAARKEGLDLRGIVADITTFTPDTTFDVLLFDRVLHMLAEPARLQALTRLLDHVDKGGSVLIADEPSNLAALHEAITRHDPHWRSERTGRAYLSAIRT